MDLKDIQMRSTDTRNDELAAGICSSGGVQGDE